MSLQLQTIKTVKMLSLFPVFSSLVSLVYFQVLLLHRECPAPSAALEDLNAVLIVYNIPLGRASDQLSIVFLFKLQYVHGVQYMPHDCGCGGGDDV